MPNSKVQLANGTVLLDLTSDTVSASTLKRGFTAHDSAGNSITGTMDGGGGGNYNVTSTENLDGTQNIAIVDVQGGITVESLSVTANGTYTAETGKAYSPVSVNVPVPSPTLQSKTATENGTVTPDSGYDGLSQVIVNVPTTVSKNIQYSNVVGKVTNKTSYTSTGSSITVSKTGNYKCTWVHYSYASVSTQYLTQLYVGSTAKGTTHACPAYNGSSGFSVSESRVSLTAGDVLTVNARTRSGTSYWTTAGMLVIEEL